jgi:hypothetical protein
LDEIGCSRLIVGSGWRNSLPSKAEPAKILAPRKHDVTTRPVENWIESTVCAFSEFARFEWLKAGALWIEADSALGCEKPSFAPLHAASRSNVGAANLIFGRRAVAERALDEADLAWQRIIAQIEALDVPITGASSSYHFRLATAAPEALIEARRDRYRRLAQGALAITRYNRSLLDAVAAGSVTVRHPAIALRQTISENLGYASPEARMLAALDGRCDSKAFRAIYADKLADIGRAASLASSLSEDCKKLEHSVTLTALLTIPISQPVLPDRPAFPSSEITSPATSLSLNDV